MGLKLTFAKANNKILFKHTVFFARRHFSEMLGFQELKFTHYLYAVYIF